MPRFRTEYVQPLGDHNPKYNCIPTKELSNYLKVPFDYLNPPQTDALQYLEEDDVNLIVGSKTSTGKTLIAEFFMARSFQNKRRILYIAPMKALADEKYESWTSESHEFSSKKIEILTGDFPLSAERKTKMCESDIIILTPEMFNSKCRSYDYNEFLHGTDLIVDEVHLIGSEERGDKLEVAIIQYLHSSPESRVLFLSATIPNINDLSAWLEQLSGKKTIEISSDYKPYEIEQKFVTFMDYNYVLRKKLSYSKREEARMEKVIELVSKCINDPTIIFIGSKDFGRKLSEKLNKLGFKNEFHNADLKRSERVRIKNSFDNGELKLLIASSSLSWGIDAQATNVILAHTAYGYTPMEPADIFQAIGRAGRRGKGYVYIVVPEKEHSKEKVRILNKYRISSRLNDINTLMFHVVNYVRDQTITCVDSFYEWYKDTLSYAQNADLSKSDFQKVLDNLAKRKMIKLVDGEKENYEITKLGEITAKMYMLPLDVSDWLLNFCLIEEINPEEHSSSYEEEMINLKVARAIANCYSFGKLGSAGRPQNSKIYIKELEKKDSLVEEIVRKLKLNSTDPSTKFTAALYANLSGKKIPPLLLPSYFAINHDIERIIGTLKLVDSVYGKHLKSNQSKVVGFNWGDEWDKLLMRAKYSVGKDLISLIQVPGLGKTFAERLHNRGISSTQQLIDPSKKLLLESILGEKRAEKIIKSAKELV